MAGKRRKKTGKIIALIIIDLMVLLVLVGLVYIVPALSHPEAMFDMEKKTVPVAVPRGELVTTEPIEPQVQMLEQMEQNHPESMPSVPEETPEPTAQEQGEFGNIISIALLGLDPDYKRYAANGGECHTDGIVVVAVDFDHHKVSLVSFPRDIFTDVPGHEGYYKINCAVNVGGGKTHDGLMTTCATLSQMLGGVPIEYYICVENQLVMELGDDIGGLDFELPFSYTGPSGAEYKKGFQHLDGAGIYDYMRVRTKAPYPHNTDVARADRCREMLLAVFQKLKNEKMLSAVPDIIASIRSGIYTNLTARQIIALANYATSFDMEKISSYAISGETHVVGWTFLFVDQQKRKEMIQSIYGFEPEPLGWCSLEFLSFLNKRGFHAMKSISQGEKLLEYAEQQGNLDEEQRTAYENCRFATEGLNDALKAIKNWYRLHETEELRRQDAAGLKLLQDQLETCTKELKTTAGTLKKAIGYTGVLRWETKQWYSDTDVNRVFVDMR